MTDQDTPLSILLEGILVTCSVLKAMFIAVFRWLIISVKRKDVHGEVVLVTGSGGAIGRQLSLEFSALGATVVLWDINESANEETADRIRRNGGTCYAYTVDVRLVCFALLAQVRFCVQKAKRGFSLII